MTASESAVGGIPGRALGYGAAEKQIGKNGDGEMTDKYQQDEELEELEELEETEKTGGDTGKDGGSDKNI